MKTGGAALLGGVLCWLALASATRAADAPAPAASPPAAGTPAPPNAPALPAPSAPPAPTLPAAGAPADSSVPAASAAPVSGAVGAPALTTPVPSAAPAAPAAPAPALVAPAAAPAAPAALAPAANPALGPPAPRAANDATYAKLREIEERVNRLKERVFQSKARLVQLQEVVLHGSISGAKLVLIHRNEMGSSFKLSQVQYALDGTVIFNRGESDMAELDKQEEAEIFNGPVAPGNHQLAVYLEYTGNGMGIFSYLEGYKFKLKSSDDFLADEGKMTTLRVVGYEKGGFTTELKDRPSVRFDLASPVDLHTEAPAVPPPTATPDAAPPAPAASP